MPAPTPARTFSAAAYATRAMFGVGFLVLGGIALYRVVIAPAPPGNKIIGSALGLAMIALGIFRITQYLRWKRGSVPPA
jgi:hypothetical protein